MIFAVFDPSPLTVCTNCIFLHLLLLLLARLHTPSNCYRVYVYQLPSLVLIAQAVYLLERLQTDRQTNTTERPTHSGGYTAGMGKWNV